MSTSGDQVSYGSFASFNKDWLPRRMTSLVDLSAEEDFIDFFQNESPEHPIEFVGLKQFNKERMKDSKLRLLEYMITLVKQNPEKHFFFGKA